VQSSEPIITLTTDFGPSAPYVAAMKGALLSVNSEARVIDLSHSIPPQDLRYTSFFLKHSLRFFPEGTIHVVVVDPGVGTSRAILCVELEGHKLLVPDNGCWTEWAALSRSVPRVWQLTEKRWWRPDVSPVFHGRDIFAPAAAHLSRGESPAQLGKPAASWHRLALPTPTLNQGHWEGEVLFTDEFGNLLTNLPGTALLQQGVPPLNITIAGVTVNRVVRTYGEAETGELIALVSSSGNLELAVVQGSAAVRLGAGTGTPVTVRWNIESTPKEVTTAK
jgi:S-adenosyl-L-methionine hydrolase (adenosine-forming)